MSNQQTPVSTRPLVRASREPDWDWADAHRAETAELRAKIVDLEQVVRHQREIASAERSRADAAVERLAVAWRVIGRVVPARQG